MKATLKKPPAPPKRTRAEWDAVIRRRETLNEERLRLNREADALSKEVTALDEELMAMVKHETTGQQNQTLTLKSFILSIVYKPPAAMALAFAALRRLAAEEKDQLAAELGKKPKLEIHWRDEPGGAAAAA